MDERKSFVLDGHSLENVYHSAFPLLAQGVSKLFLAMPKAFPNPYILCSGCLVLSVRVQSRLTIISDLPKILSQP